MSESRLRREREAASPPPLREPALDMEPVRGRLRSLREHIPGALAIEVEYARYLALRLNDELVPAGFVMANLIAIDELSRDYYQTEDQRVPSEFRPLVGNPPVFYELIPQGVPQLAQAVLPSDFAEAVATRLRVGADLS